MKCDKCKKEVEYTRRIGIGFYGKYSPYICLKCIKEWRKVYREKVKISMANWREVFEEWMKAKKEKVMFT